MTPDAFAALRARPWQLLGSRWPWLSLLYVATTVPVGLITLLVLTLVIGFGLLTVIVVVGLLVLTGVPLVATAVATVERRRLRWVLPSGAAPGPAPSVRERLRAGRALPLSWAELGLTVLVATVFWFVDGAVLSFVVTVPGGLLAAPVLVRTDQIQVFGWTVDTAAEGWQAAAVGLAGLVLAAYVVTALACGQAALSRLLLDPREARLAAAVADLRRSRVELVDAFEAERRRIERDLHDGVQQRLVALTMTLGQAELDVPGGAGLELVRVAHRQAEEALTELRTTVRGIHPRVLADHGLTAAVHEIADRSPVPVDTEIRLTGRLPPPVEAAAYFVVSEALTNVVRHASARTVQVHAWQQDGRLVLTVVDDGVGGARVGAGSGLAGLALRLEALDGRLDVSSPPGGPTEVRMECPTG